MLNTIYFGLKVLCVNFGYGLLHYKSIYYIRNEKTVVVWFFDPGVLQTIGDPAIGTQ